MTAPGYIHSDTGKKHVGILSRVIGSLSSREISNCNRIVIEHPVIIPKVTEPASLDISNIEIDVNKLQNVVSIILNNIFISFIQLRKIVILFRILISYFLRIWKRYKFNYVETF